MPNWKIKHAKRATVLFIIAYLQDENKVVDRFAPLVDVVMGRAFVAFDELDFLDHIRMAQDSQQHLVWDLRWTEQAHLCGKRHRERRLRLVES